MNTSDYDMKNSTKDAMLLSADCPFNESELTSDWCADETSSSANKTKKTIYLVLFVLLTIFSLLPIASHAKEGDLAGLFSTPKSKFLKVTEAFQTIPKKTSTGFLVDFVVTPKHYIYKDKVKVTLPNGKLLAPLTFNQKPDQVIDPEFGKVNVFQKNVQLSFKLPKTIKAGTKLTLHWQGCAKAGLCYPPVKETIVVKKKP